MKRNAKYKAPWLAALAVVLSFGGCGQQTAPGSMESTASDTGSEAVATTDQDTDLASYSYETQREALLAQELAPQELTESEEVLDKLLTEMKAEAVALFADGSPYGINDWSKPAVSESRLFRFCKALPKGADLHARDAVAIRTDTFIDLLLGRNNIAILLDESEDNGKLYVLGTEGIPEFATPLQEALATPEEEGAEPLLTREMLREFLTGGQDNADWIDLNSLDSKVVGLAQDQEFLNAIYQAYYGAYVQNGVNLVELRVPMQTDDAANTVRLNAIRDAYYAFKNGNPDFVVRVIAYPSSGTNKETSCDELRSAIRLGTQIMDGFNVAEAEAFIIGLDLGSENDSVPLKEYVDFLRSDEVSDSGLKLFLHCGESLDTTNDSVVDAYLLGASRIGHGITLYRFPALMDSYANDTIAIEVCPTSNYRKGYIGDLRLHPGLLYIRNGNQVVLGSRDGAFAEPSVLTDDFFAAILCWDLSLADVKALCQNSILYSGLPQDEIDLQLAVWEYNWADFIAQMIREG